MNFGFPRFRGFFTAVEDREREENRLQPYRMVWGRGRKGDAVISLDAKRLVSNGECATYVLLLFCDIQMVLEKRLLYGV